jgi:hypothetical protein
VTGFLTSLAGLARGDVGVGAARVALPPRLAPEPAEAPQSEAGAEEAQPLRLLSRPAALQPERPVVEPQVLRGEPTHAPGPPRTAPAAQDPPPRRARADDRDARPPVRRVHLRAPRRDAAVAAPPLADAPPALPPPGRLPGLRIDAEVAPSVKQAGPPAPTTEHPAPAPLSEAAIASRVTTAQDSRPVIHVTIDRIDVRAAEASKPAAAAAKPAQRRPTVSLADYLRREPGGRA